MNYHLNVGCVTKGKFIEILKRKTHTQNVYSILIKIFRTRDLNNLKAHMEIHSVQNTEYKWICEQCGRAFRRKKTLNEHINVLHSDERPLKCDQCDER